LHINAIFLPRQAQDKHRENSKQTTVFQGANGQDCAHSFNEQRACGVPVSVADKVSAAGGTAAAAAAPLLVLLLLV
jgi:hypothetical protein